MGYFVDTPIKIEKVADHPSLLKTTSDQFSEKEQNTSRNNLNKTTVYLLTRQNLKNKQLLLIQPESRLTLEKDSVNNRHHSFLENVVGIYEPRQKTIKETHRDRLSFKLARLEKKSQESNFKKFAKTRNTKSKKKPIYSFDLYRRKGKLCRQYFRSNQFSYSQKKNLSKSICPVFFDKVSAEEFLLQNTEFSRFNKTTEEKKFIIILMKNLLDGQEASKQKFLDDFTKLQDLLDSQQQNLKQIENKIVENKQNFRLNLKKKFVTKPKIESLKELTKEKIKTYDDQNTYFEETFKNYQKTFEFLKSFSKDKKPRLFSKKVSSSLKEISQTKIISIGLGDLIDSYSNLPRSNDLKNFEFLFFPKMHEEKKSLVSIFGKEIDFGKGVNDFSKKIIDSKTTTKTFKNYQKEYFGKL